MIIKSLELHNFRRFGNLEIDFDPKLTIIAGQNNHGLTSVLDGIAIAASPYVGAFDIGNLAHIQDADVRAAPMHGMQDVESLYPAKVRASFELPGKSDDCEVVRVLNGSGKRTSVNQAKSLIDYGKEMQAMVRRGWPRENPLPVISYYGAGRKWITRKSLDRRNALGTSCTTGYVNCLSSSPSYLQCQKWLAEATYAAWEEVHLGVDPSLRTGIVERLGLVRSAVDEALALEDLGGFSYSPNHKEMTLLNHEAGRLPMSLMGNGVREMAAMVADIAYRCVLLNGYLGLEAIQKTPGIVLIDNVEMGHCVWDFSKDIAERNILIFHIGDIDGSTLGFNWQTGNIVHHNGVRDRKPTKKEEEIEALVVSSLRSIRDTWSLINERKKEK